MPEGRRKGEKLIALLLVGFLALNYPLLALFSKAVIWMGIPALYLYLFVFWALFIGLMCAVMEDRETQRPSGKANSAERRT